MDYIKEYRQFVSSYYFNEAVRITVGITLPSVILNFFGMLEIGLIASLGAMAVSAADIPGHIKERRNGMLAALALIFFVDLVTGFAHVSQPVTALVILTFSFSLSMLGVYNARTNAIGFAGLLIMVLTLYHKATGWNVVLDGIYLLCGGLWYIGLSLALHGVRPYKVIQQALGDSIIAVADYLKTRSYFYNEGVNYDKTYKNLMQQQQKVQDKQILVREMLFKSRNIVKSTTLTGRGLLVIFVESVDLFEKANATFYNYESMHRRFDGTNILPHFRKVILGMVDELYEIGVSVQEGRRSRVSKNLNDELRELKQHFEKFVNTHRNADNLEALINMRKIMQSIEDMILRIYTLHHYTRYERKEVKDYLLSDNYDSFVEKTDLDGDLIRENLSLQSNTFRHALRLGIAMTLGYITAVLLQLEYSYWILLTALVILKPTYSVTKQRNYQRVIGTIIGAMGGIGLLFLLQTQTGRFTAMILLMIATYSFMRTRYLVSVTFMTAYVLILFFLLDSRNFHVVIENRILDTIIGSVIAGLTTYIIPSWEKKQVKTYMAAALEKTRAYFETVASAYIKNEPAPDYKLSRKEAFVAQANLSGTFSRMLSEPKSKQKNIKTIHQFVVMIFTINSHIATLAHYSRLLAAKYRSPVFTPVIENTIHELGNTSGMLSDETVAPQVAHSDTQALKAAVKDLLEKRRHEIQQGLLDTETKITLNELKPIIDQFLLISRASGDLNKLAETLTGLKPSPEAEKLPLESLSAGEHAVQ
ncbi:FUSC family protein [Niabella beijingensis]|uniref:FUSC family protein n=1 Tax=Niabella beijingensis TaxID=2872700 RepID=UPI001CBE74D1|nr:FUSC family membrane protein [Niabella beijingensis]MBZ4189589.1 FUSC family protein [Niabella beijingensis]